MTITYGFYNSLAGDRKYDAIQISQIFKGMIVDGIFSTVGGALAVTPQAGMNINVASGRAWFNDTWTDNDSTLVLTVVAAEVALNRIDTVVVEVNSDIGTRANAIKIIKGTPGSSPVAPTLANTATLHQYGLADIYVGAGVTSINSGNITNRIGSVGTPYATSLMASAQITDLTNKYNYMIAGWIDNSNTWSYSSADSPTFVVSVNADVTTGFLAIRVGNKVRFTQDATVKYFIVTKVGTFSGGVTLVTLYGGTDYTVTANPITGPQFSRERSPNGFDINPEKWTVSIITSDTPTKTSPTATNWYGGALLTPSGPLINIPIGSWRVRYMVVAEINITLAAVAGIGCRITLSTGTSTESDPEFSTGVTVSIPVGTDLQRAFYTTQKDILLTAKTLYSLNIFTGNSGATSILMNPSGAFRTVVKAISNYL